MDSDEQKLGPAYVEIHSMTALHHHHHHHLFLKRLSFHAQLGLDVPPEMKPLHISLNTAHSGCKPSASISSFTHSYQVFLPLPAHLTPATTTFLQADTQSSPLYTNYTNPHCVSYPSATLHTSISPSSVPFSPDFADLPSSSPRSQSHMSMHSGHKPCISFPSFSFSFYLFLPLSIKLWFALFWIHCNLIITPSFIALICFQSPAGTSFVVPWQIYIYFQK